MPSNSKKSVLDKYKTKIAAIVDKHKDDPIDWGNMRVPPGITNGIARLTVCEFGEVAAGKQNAGKPYFRAAGVIVEPESVIVNGVEVPCRGLQTSIMEMVCDTKTKAGKATTMEEHVASIQNELKKLGGEGFDVSDLEDAAAALTAAAPYFRFSTSQGQPTKDFPDPRIWENWYGGKGLEDYSPPEEAAVSDDQTGVEEGDETETDESGDGEPPDDERVATSEAPDEYQLMELAEQADAKDKTGKYLASAKEPQKQLKQAALDAGIDEEEVDAADDWAHVARLIVEAATGDGDGDGAGSDESQEEGEEVEETVEEEAAVEAPAKGDNFEYVRTFVGKDKKKVSKKLDVEVVSVNEENETAVLKDLATGKVLSNGQVGKDKKPLPLRVKWSDLTPA